MAIKRIAITGGIGSGKSTVLNIIRKLGYAVFSCDEIYSKIVTSKEYINKIQELFPNVVKSGIIDKKELSSIVFNDEKKRKQLNEVAHPLIMQALYKAMDSCAGYAFAEIPLLFEGNYQSNFDLIIVIMRDEQERLDAIIHRDKITVREAKKRITSQFDYNSNTAKKLYKKNNALLLYNNASETELENKLTQILHDCL